MLNKPFLGNDPNTWLLSCAPVNLVVSLMDDNNKKATDVLASKGVDVAVEHMLKHPETGEKMDYYATMRYFYD